jgi:hypothetical protein
MRRGGFLRYLAFYVCARCLYDVGRSVVRKQTPATPPCEHGSLSALSTLLLLAFIVVASLVVAALMGALR